MLAGLLKKDQVSLISSGQAFVIFTFL